MFKLMFFSKKKPKSNLHYTRIPFRVSRENGAHLGGFAPCFIL